MQLQPIPANLASNWLIPFGPNLKFVQTAQDIFPGDSCILYRARLGTNSAEAPRFAVRNRHRLTVNAGTTSSKPTKKCLQNFTRHSQVQARPVFRHLNQHGAKSWLIEHAEGPKLVTENRSPNCVLCFGSVCTQSALSSLFYLFSCVQTIQRR
jgi:hypothetical protein